MPDLKKVIKGLRCCRDIHKGATLEESCNICPYQVEHGRTCMADELFYEAIALLKAQGPRLMTDEELMDRIRKAPIVQIPAVDAVPVVRCRDCAHFRPNVHDRGDDSRCALWNVEMYADDYCCNAETRADDYCSKAQRRCNEDFCEIGGE